MAYNTQEERLKVKGSESITRDLQVTGDVYVGGDLTVDNSTVLTEADKGVSNGVATLDATGRVPYSQLPESAMEYKGTWDASTNTPTLADGTGTNGDFYIVSVAGTVNLGTVANPRNVTFYVNDRIIYDGATSQWERLPAAEVRTVNGQTGDVVLTANDIDYDSNTTVKAEIDKKANSASLATVATTGDYDDLLNKPNIPPTVIPDAVMSDTSRNPVENKVIKQYVDSLQPTGAVTTVQNNNLTADRVVVSNTNGKLAASGITTTLLGYLSGATGNIQDQITNNATNITNGNVGGGLFKLVGSYEYVNTSGTLTKKLEDMVGTDYSPGKYIVIAIGGKETNTSVYYAPDGCIWLIGARKINTNPYGYTYYSKVLVSTSSSMFNDSGITTTDAGLTKYRFRLYKYQLGI